jgi:hypothetical protein
VPAGMDNPMDAHCATRRAIVGPTSASVINPSASANFSRRLLSAVNARSSRGSGSGAPAGHGCPPLAQAIPRTRSAGLHGFDDGPLVPDGGLTRYAWLNGFYDTDSPGRVIWKQFTTGKQLNRYGSERQTRDSPSATIRSGGRSRQMTGQRQTGGPQLLFEFGSRFVVGQLIDFDPIGPTLRFGRCHARIRGEAFFWRRLPSVHNRGRFGLMVGSLPR